MRFDEESLEGKPDSEPSSLAKRKEAMKAKAAAKVSAKVAENEFVSPANKDRVDLARNEQNDRSYQKAAREYAEKHGYRIVDTLAEALRERPKGQKVLTIREADVACRSKLNLSSALISFALIQPKVGTFIREWCDPELPPNKRFPDDKEEQSVYSLRRRFNQGVFWRNSRRAKDTPENVRRGDTILAELIERLTELYSAPNEEELQVGFSEELLTGEFVKR